MLGSLKCCVANRAYSVEVMQAEVVEDEYEKFRISTLKVTLKKVDNGK